MNKFNFKLKKEFPACRQAGIKLMLRRTLVRSVLYSAFTLGAFSLYAQRVLTLEDAIALALKNNYDIQLSRNDSAIAALDYSYRNWLFAPRLNASVGNVWNNNHQNQEFTNGTKREGDVKTDNLAGSVTLSWLLFDGGKMFVTRNQAQEIVRLGELGIKDQVVNTVAQIINSYYIIVRQKQQLKAIEEQMSINQTRVDLTQRRLEIGVGNKPDVLQSKVDLNAQVAARYRQLTLIEELKERLNQTMNAAVGTNYEVSDSIPFNNDLTLAQIQNNLEQTNPTLQIQKKNIDLAELTIKSRKADQFPLISFNSAYNYNRTNNDVTLNTALPLYNRNRGYNYGLSATIPILNYRNTNRLIKQAKLDLSYQQLVYESQRSTLNLNVINFYREYELQKKMLDLEETNILLAKENVNIQLELFRLGSSTIIQLRDAQLSLEDAYDRLIAARYNTKLAETELMRLKGELIK
ncbi:MAG TPA: TolC family protein [Chitinophagaceae bacterium]|jgi:outer membrane protein TolC|nr:TolC family protein [Chitinophagaceae bacterium]